MWPPPLTTNFLSRAFFITNPISKSKTDLADPFKLSCDAVKTIDGLLKISFNLEAMMPIRPSLMVGS